MANTTNDPVVTQSILKAELQEFRKEMMREMMKKMHKEIQTSERRLEKRLRKGIVDEIKVLNEQLVSDFRGAEKDKLSLHDDKLQDHGRRLTRVENHVGLMAA